MSISNLLGHFGVHVPRYITLDGQVIRDGVSTTATGALHHPSHGPVTAVPPHTFHGGVEGSVLDDAVTLTTASGVARTTPTTSARWFNDAVEVDRHDTALQAVLPGFTLNPAGATATTTKPPSWSGIINTGRGRFAVSIHTRTDGGLPRIEPTQPHRLGKYRAGRWVPAPHTFTNRNLCIADEADWNPDEHTVADAALWTAHWYAAYTEWFMNDGWPQDGYHRR